MVATDTLPTFQLASAISLSSHLQNRFKSGSISIHPDLKQMPLASLTDCSGAITLRGSLNLSYQEFTTKTNARCAFHIPLNWKSSPPVLRCIEQWVQRPGGTMSADWHICINDSLCYVLDLEWQDALAAAEQSVGQENLAEFASFYAVNNSRWLLFHHLLGYRENLTTWQKEWPQRPHHALGKFEYLIERTRQMKRRLPGTARHFL